jgi:hypothetical protein
VQTTTVHGTLADLQGHWLVLFDMKSNAMHRTIASFVEIQEHGGKLEVTERSVALPAEMTAEIDAASKKAAYWEPTPEQLAELHQDWATLAVAPRGIAQVANEIWGMDAFDDSIRKEEVLTGAMWVLRQTVSFEPGGQRPVTQVNIFGAKTREGGGWRGEAALAQVIAAPFPVPLTLYGTFRMLRMGETPEPRGLLARLAAAFKGCGR